MSPGRLALLVQLGSTLPMVGLIWFVQVVAYPQFRNVDAGSFAAYHAAHSRLISFIVGPLMCAELLGAIGGVAWPSEALPRGLAMLGLGLVVVAWGVTAFVSVPAHNVLAGGFEPQAHGGLVATNWARTVAWSARGGLLLWAVARSLGPDVLVVR